MGLHTGEAERLGGRYAGAPLYRCARLLATAHGGQVVLSAATAELVQDELPGGRLRDLGAHRLQDLARPERVFQLLHPALPADFPPLRTLDALPHNLPLQLTSFVGRERELGEVRAALAAHRLVTLTGPGGVGKTRLALQAAAAALEAHPDGVWLAELGGLADPGLVPQAVAAAAGVREEPGQALAATLGGGPPAAAGAAGAGQLRAPPGRLRRPGGGAAAGRPRGAGAGHQPGAPGRRRRGPLPRPAARPAPGRGRGAGGARPGPGAARPERGGAPLRRAGGGRAPRLRGDGGERGRRGPDLPAPGRPPAGPGAGRRPGAGPGRG